ncbi:nucleoporin complex subunit 54-domain-containing protein [Xylariomycetidae sp. FL0641]|nr:nucleoporin complex subunit 54-domain-containing protein [Xylariomycetidae sp. FL0641]
MFGSRAGSTFGASTNTFGQPANNSSLFGASTNQPQTQSQPQSTSLFGGGLLGQSSMQQQQQPQLQQQQQQQQQQQPAASTMLGASQAPVSRNSIWEPGRDNMNHKPVTEQMESLLARWDPANPNTAFKYYFYNKVDQSRIPFYQPGPNEDPREWEQAVHDKPAPGYMPALGTGFRALSERLLMQKSVLSNYRQALHAINASLDAILSQNDLQISVRAVNARRRHGILRQRCLVLASKVQVLRNKGYSLDKEEDELKMKLEKLDNDLSDPALSARTEELWTRLISLKGYADNLRIEIERRGSEQREGLGEEAESKAKKILEDYDKQLQTLKGQVESIKKDYDEWQAEANPPTTK